MLRISASDLDSIRYHLESETSTQEDLIRRLRHEEEPTNQMRAGRAFAKVMETADVGELGLVEMDGYTFDFRGMDGELALPPLRELKVERLVETLSGPVTLVAKTDGVGGRNHDQKLTERFDVERYTDSLQWRVYLWLFGTREFVYDVFTAKYLRPEYIDVLRLESFSFYSYPGIEGDVMRAVSQLAAIMTDLGIDGSYPERKEKAA